MNERLNHILNILNPKVPNRVLLFLAAVVWGYASVKILIIGEKTYLTTSLHYWHILLFSIPVFLLFHFFIFHKIILKHTSRIINKTKPKTCIFSFFDWKSYLMMAFMITLGISVRKFELLPLKFIAEFYIGLGLALLTAAVYLFYYAIRFQYSKKKFALE
jgi:hypothetical protein